MSRLNFKLEAVAPGSSARAATFTTLHGSVQTPIFMPVGTQATVKSQTADSLKTVGSNVLLANTYHLLLRPGIEVFKKFGGIHQFMQWNRPVLTDSGGFQIFSLPHSREMNEDGARFQSYVDGKMILLSPEVSIETQKAINSDIMMVLDQCIPSTSSHAQAKAAMDLTHRWAKRSLAARGDSLQSMFGIVQGACFQDLRKESADFLSSLAFDGFGIGGLAVGETKQEREDFTELTTSFLPQNLPRYLMGVGTPIDILEAVHRGVDMFDCILPSQLAQRGIAFTSLGKFQLRRSVYKFVEEKLDPNCFCSTCNTYSKAYLHHLNKSEEVLGWHLLALHNFTFYHQLMKEIRANILEGTFLEYYLKKREELVRTDDENPSPPMRKPRIPKIEKNRTLGDYEIHDSPKGFSSIRQISSGEVMHSVSKPDEEAYELYVKPSNLYDRLLKADVAIWDVGLGAAHNAMAAIREFLKIQNDLPVENQNKLTIISFENDLDSLKLALKHPTKFTHLQHAAPHALLKQGEWSSQDGRINWKLIHGSFFEFMNSAPAPDLVYYDLFSSKSDLMPWRPEVFSQMKACCQGRAMKLLNYSNSTLFRATLLAEGFFVAKGAGTGPKADTTIAFTTPDEAQLHGSLLGKEWLTRWARSGAKYPLDISEEHKPNFEAKILNHPQFVSDSVAII